MLGINSLAGSTVQLKYQSIIKTQQPDASVADVARPAAKPATASVDAVKPAPKQPAAPAIDAFAAPKVDPASIFAGSFQDIFNNFDSDKNGLVTKEEIVTMLKSAGADDAGVEAFVNNVLSSTTDTNDDGALSMVELNRRLKADAGDAFAAYDLNSDGNIGEAELSEAIKRFQAAGLKVDEANVRRIYGEADLDQNKSLTLAEFNNYNKYGKASDDTRAFEMLFHKFDGNADGKVTREEALKSLMADGMDDKSANAMLDNIFSMTTDVDGDGAMSIAELRRRVAADKGDTFAMADLDNSGEISVEELKEAITLYQKAGNKVDTEFVLKAFADADADKNGILTRAEFSSLNDRINSDVDAVATAKPEPVVIADKPLPQAPVSIASADVVIPQPKIQPIMPAALEAQLFLALQEDKA